MQQNKSKATYRFTVTIKLQFANHNVLEVKGEMTFYKVSKFKYSSCNETFPR